MATIKKNLFYAAGQIFVQAVIYLILYRYLLNNIGIEKIGIWSIVLATTSAAKISEMGFAASITKFVATYHSKKQNIAVSECIQTASFTLALGIAVILLLLYPLLKWSLHYFLPIEGLEDGLKILPFALISLWITSVANIWMSSLDGCLRSDLRAIIMMIGSIVLLLTSIILVKPFGLVGLAIAQIIQSVFLLFAGWLAIRNILSELPILPFQWKISRFKEMFTYAFNFQINSVVMMLFDPVAKILLGKFGDLATVGYFEMAQRLVTMARNLIIQSNRVIVPVFAGIDNDRTSEHTRLYRNNLKYLFFILTPLFAILLGLLPTISEVWIGYYNEQFIIMAISLTIAWYLNSITAPAYFAYLGQGDLFWVTASHVTMGFINLSFGYVLGSFFEWKGVIASFCFALIVGSFVPAWTYQRKVKLSIKTIFSRHDVLLFILCFTSSIASIIGNQYMQNTNMYLRMSLIITWLISTNIFFVWIHPIRKEILLMLFKSKLKT